MEKKTIRSGAPYLMAGLSALLYALIMGLGGVGDYLIAAVIACVVLLIGMKLFPSRVVEVETAPKSGNAEVDALICEAREQLDAIRRANDAIAEPQLSKQIDDIESTCRQILKRLEEQPGMLSSMRTFLRYYLPVTLKLLNARAELEGEVQSGRAGEIAGRIRDAMAQVQSAVHKQLDALTEYRFINLESEMDVLSDMLKSDGLTSEEDASPDMSTDSTDDPFSGLFSKQGN